MRNKIMFGWKKASEQKRGDIERNRLKKHSKRIGVDGILKQNQSIRPIYKIDWKFNIK